MTTDDDRVEGGTLLSMTVNPLHTITHQHNTNHTQSTNPHPFLPTRINHLPITPQLSRDYTKHHTTHTQSTPLLLLFLPPYPTILLPLLLTELNLDLLLLSSEFRVLPFEVVVLGIIEPNQHQCTSQTTKDV